MAEQVGAIDGGWRKVIHQEEIGARAGSDAADGGSPDLFDDVAVAGEERGVGFGGAHARIAGADFLQLSCSFKLVPHTRGIAVCPQSHADSEAKQGREIRDADRVVAIRLRIVDHVDTAPRKRIAVRRGEVDAVRRERLFVEHARIAEAADRRGVAAVFGHVDMEARTERLVGLHTGGERPVAQREGRVQAEHAAHQRARADALKKADILANPLASAAAAVAVGGLVAGGAAQADVVEGALDGIQATGAGMRAGVMIDHGAHTAAGGLDQSGERAVIDIVLVKGAVETPPELFQNTGEIGGRGAGQAHAAGQRAVEVGVTVDERRHEQAACEIHRVGVKRAPAAHEADGAVGEDFHAARMEHAIGSVEGEDACVGEYHDATMCVPLSPRMADATCWVQVMMHSSPPPSTNSMAEAIFGPMDPAGNSPAARYARAWASVMVSSHCWPGRPKRMAARSTLVTMINFCACRWRASRLEARSLSTTPSTPTRRLPSHATGMPPPPQAITTTPAWSRHAMASSSMMRSGWGDATTRRHCPGEISASCQ